MGAPSFPIVWERVEVNIVRPTGFQNDVPSPDSKPHGNESTPTIPWMVSALWILLHSTPHIAGVP